MKNFKIIFYEAITGECPIEEFQDSLDKKMRVKLIGMLEIPEEKGNMLREPYSKSLGEGMFKLRCKFEKDNIDRWFYKQDQKNANRTNSDNKSKVKRFFRKDGAE